MRNIQAMAERGWSQAVDMTDLVRAATARRVATMAKNPIHPQGEPRIPAIKGVIEVAMSTIAMKVAPAMEPNARHCDFEYPAINSRADRYIRHSATAEPSATVPRAPLLIKARANSRSSRTSDLTAEWPPHFS